MENVIKVVVIIGILYMYFDELLHKFMEHYKFVEAQEGVRKISSVVEERIDGGGVPKNSQELRTLLQKAGIDKNPWGGEYKVVVARSIVENPCERNKATDLVVHIPSRGLVGDVGMVVFTPRSEYVPKGPFGYIVKPIVEEIVVLLGFKEREKTHTINLNSLNEEESLYIVSASHSNPLKLGTLDVVHVVSGERLRARLMGEKP